MSIASLWTPNRQETKKVVLDEVATLKEGDYFWIRDVYYRVVKVHSAGVTIVPVAYGKTTEKRIRRRLKKEGLLD